MKHKMNILIPVFILLVLVYAVRAFAGTRIQAETLRRGSMEDMVSAKGVVIKYETVTAAEGGTVEALVQEGARVGAGQEIAAVYTGSVDPQLRTRLDQVNNKIVQVEKNQSGLFSFSGDVTRLEQTITEKTAELIAYSRAKNLTAASETQLVLEALCAPKRHKLRVTRPPACWKSCAPKKRSWKIKSVRRSVAYMPRHRAFFPLRLTGWRRL